ncbi:MAG: hypothetical protein QXZ22_08995 [Sulfolobales archaeon]
MQFPKIFAAAFAVAAGIAIAGALAGSSLFPGTSLERFRPPEDVYSYNPPPTGVPLLGDFVWALAQVIKWMGSAPQTAAALIAAVGVPEPLASILIAVIYISFAAFIIYLVGGRILSPRY